MSSRIFALACSLLVGIACSGAGSGAPSPGGPPSAASAPSSNVPPAPAQAARPAFAMRDTTIAPIVKRLSEEMGKPVEIDAPALATASCTRTSIELAPGWSDARALVTLDATLETYGLRVQAAPSGGWIVRKVGLAPSRYSDTDPLGGEYCDITADDWTEWILRGVKKRADGHYEIRRDHLELFGRSLGDTHPDFERAPSGQRGLVLRHRSAARLYEALGSRDGDVIQSVAGVPTDWNAGHRSLEAAKMTNGFDVVLERDGKPMTIRYTITEPPAPGASPPLSAGSPREALVLRGVSAGAALRVIGGELGKGASIPLLQRASASCTFVSVELPQGWEEETAKTRLGAALESSGLALKESANGWSLAEVKGPALRASCRVPREAVVDWVVPLIRRESEVSWVVSRDALRLLSEHQIVPALLGGDATGLTVSLYRDRKLFESLGAQEGDVVVTIAGKKVTGSWREVETAVLAASAFDIVLKRKGREIRLRYNVTD